jgi:hypothetical protein
VPRPAGPNSAAPTLEALGELCLHHLAENPAQLMEFMSITGYSPDALRRAAGSRGLALGLLDHFAANEPLLLAFCANSAMRPEDFMRVWARANPAG